jgi:PAS domain-containing protein
MRAQVESTQLISRPVWRNPRVHLLDDIWLAIIVAILITTAIPWLASGFDVDVGMATWGLLALGGIHIAFVLLGSPLRVPGGWSDRALTFLSLGGVVVIGFIWQHAGALRNPMFLMVFALPVVSSIFLSRWHPYLLAAASVLVVATLALSQAPELRWYAAGLLGSDSWLTWLFGPQGTGSQPSFMGFSAPSSYLVLLEVFTVLLFACAFAAEYLGSLFERLNAHSAMALADAERAQALWTGLIERLPFPALLIDSETLRIIAASELANTYLRSDPVPLEGRKLFDAVKFSFPDIVQELIGGNDGGVPRTAVHVADEIRMAQAWVVHITHNGQRLALLTLEDVTELFCARSALDTSEYAALVIDWKGRILVFNKPAVALFGKLEAGVDADRLLPRSEQALAWWEPGLGGRRKVHLEIGPRVFQVTGCAIALPGEEERFYSVSLLPVAKAENADSFGTGSRPASSIVGPIR